MLPLCPAPCSASNLLPAHPRLDVHVQVSNTHDWHGTRKLARANEQQKLQQQQKAKQRQQEQKQAKKRQQQQNGGETRVSTLALNPSGARSADDAKVIYSLGTRRGHSPTLTSHGHRFDSELKRLEAEAARRKERLEHKKQRKRKRDRSAHNRRTNKRKNRQRSDCRKAHAQTRSKMAHVLWELLNPARTRQTVEITAVQMVAATETEPAVAAAMGCNAGEEAGYALASRTVQARLSVSLGKNHAHQTAHIPTPLP